MDDELNTKSMTATLRGGMQAGVLTVQEACQSSHQRCVSEDGLAVRVDHA